LDVLHDAQYIAPPPHPLVVVPHLAHVLALVVHVATHVIDHVVASGSKWWVLA